MNNNGKTNEKSSTSVEGNVLFILHVWDQILNWKM